MFHKKAGEKNHTQKNTCQQLESSKAVAQVPSREEQLHPQREMNSAGIYLDQEVQVHILGLGRRALFVACVAAAGDEIDTHVEVKEKKSIYRMLQVVHTTRAASKGKEPEENEGRKTDTGLFN